MARKLEVYLHAGSVGQPEQDDSGVLRFGYDNAWLPTSEKTNKIELP